MKPKGVWLTNVVGGGKVRESQGEKYEFSVKMLIFLFALLSSVIEPLSGLEAVYGLMSSIILLARDCSLQHSVTKSQPGENKLILIAHFSRD